MESINFTKDGLREIKYDPESQTYNPHLIEQDRILACLRQPCQIDRDVTLGDFFRAVSEFGMLRSFIVYYSWCWKLDEFHAEALKPPTPKESSDAEKLEYVEVSMLYEIDEDRVQPENSSIQHGTDFHGISKSGQRWGISLTPMNELAHLPIRLKPTAPLTGFRGEAHGEYPYTFSLLEVLDAVYDDISYHGGPAERQEFTKELMHRYEEVQSGTAKLIPLEDVLGKDPIN